MDAYDLEMWQLLIQLVREAPRGYIDTFRGELFFSGEFKDVAEVLDERIQGRL
jgi:hypothetical protein